MLSSLIFVGTITENDVFEEILFHHAIGDWKPIEEASLEGRISLEEWMVQQYKMIRGTYDNLIKTVNHVTIRSGFDSFLNFIVINQIKKTILSAGISFVIDYFIEVNSWDIDYISGNSNLTNDGIIASIPNYNRSIALDFKSYHIKQSKNDGFKVAYIGAGSSDFNAIGDSDFRFCVGGSLLSKFCKKNKLDIILFNSFEELIHEFCKILC